MPMPRASILGFMLLVWPGCGHFSRADVRAPVEWPWQTALAELCFDGVVCL